MEKDILYLKSKDYVLMIKDENTRIFGDYSLPETIAENVNGSVLNRKQRLENLLKNVKEQTGISIIRPKFKGSILFKDYSGKESIHTHIYSAENYTGKFKKEQLKHPVWKNEREFSEKPEYNLISEWMNKEGSFIGYIVSNGAGVIKEDSFAEFINFQAI